MGDTDFGIAIWRNQFGGADSQWFGVRGGGDSNFSGRHRGDDRGVCADIGKRIGVVNIYVVEVFCGSNRGFWMGGSGSD